MPSISKNNGVHIERCPHCGVANPALQLFASYTEHQAFATGRWTWWMFQCRTCRAPVVFNTHTGDTENNVHGQFPTPGPLAVADELPERAKHHLLEAIKCVNAGAASVAMVACAAAVDARLKNQGFKTGSLYSRIDAARAAHTITAGMAEWAHHVRIGANEQRHDDEDAPLPTVDDAKRCIEFVEALGVLLFVLPARVTKGLEAKASTPT